VKRLLEAQVQLQQRAPSLQLAIFDAWRPVAVQAFMVNHAIAEECRRQGVDPSDPGQKEALSGVITEVGRFWAPPSDDPATPPPHSTGAAVDLTLAESGAVLDMGGEIDAIGAVSEPDHHLTAARSQPQSQAAVWQRRRDLLKEVMVAAGFEQHPNEWWHFSHGDQLWAWRCGAPEAIYAGALVPSSSATV
jgi:D-alanyl-D-alanine dipeptidase